MYVLVIDNHTKALRDVAINDSVLLDFLDQQVIQNKTWVQFLCQESSNFTSALSSIKDFAVWFKREFPYYYNGCFYCTASGEFLGIASSSDEERKFKSNVTEIYWCSNCSSFHRFPRFNNVMKVLETRRGRCGEYSNLFQRILRLLGYQTRWVADYTGHVWVEALILSESSTGNDRWVHVDPCEAAIDEPMIYQSWGKNLSYIVAVGDPLSDIRAFALTKRRIRGMYPVTPQLYRNINSYSARADVKIDMSNETEQQQSMIPDDIVLVDVIESYTTDVDSALSRRDLERVDSDAILRKLSSLEYFKSQKHM